MKVTLSVIKADIGGLVGHCYIHPDLLEIGEESLKKARNEGLVMDYHITAVGDDLQLIITHNKGVNAEPIHRLAWETFEKAAARAKELKLYGAGQDLIKEAFSGNIRGMGPGLAEMEFEERPSEPIIIFIADKTSAGAWNLPLYRIFADPFNTIGLVISPSMHDGFAFEVHDVKAGTKVLLKCPEELYDLLLLIGSPSRYAIKAVYHKATGEIAAVSSTERLSLIAGRYVGKDDPVCVVRCQHEFPAVGEVLEPFAFPHLVEGWMRGSHHGPLMPVALRNATPTRFDGPPRVVALGFQLTQGHLIGPKDLFDDPSFDEARRFCNAVADYLRRHGPFEPHRLPMEEMEYTTLPQVLAKLKDRFEEI